MNFWKLFGSTPNNDINDNCTSDINPANGLPMLDDCADIHGNLYGTDALNDADAGFSGWTDDL